MDLNTRIHAWVWRSLGFCFFGILGVFIFAFRASPPTLFMLAVCVIYLLMYLGGPLIALKTSGEQLDDGTSLREFLARPFDSYTGIITGAQAWLQICMVPVALFITSIGMAIVISFAQVPH